MTEKAKGGCGWCSVSRTLQEYWEFKSIVERQASSASANSPITRSGAAILERVLLGNWAACAGSQLCYLPAVWLAASSLAPASLDVLPWKMDILIQLPHRVQMRIRWVDGICNVQCPHLQNRYYNEGCLTGLRGWLGELMYVKCLGKCYLRPGEEGLANEARGEGWGQQQKQEVPPGPQDVTFLFLLPNPN